MVAAGLVSLTTVEELNSFQKQIGDASCWLLGFVVSGELKITIQQSQKRFKHGDLLLVAPDLLASLGQTWLVEQLELRWVAFQARQHWYPWLNWRSSLTEQMGYTQVNNQRLEEELETLFVNITDYSHRRTAFAQEMAMSYSEQLLIRCQIMQIEGQMEQQDPRVLEACAYIKENHHQPLTVAEIAEKVSLSPSRLSHLFKQELGVGVLRWRDMQRMQRACEFLRTTNLSISEIGMRVGYEDSMFFGRMFRKHMGCTPSEYRKAKKLS